MARDKLGKIYATYLTRKVEYSYSIFQVLQLKRKIKDLQSDRKLSKGMNRSFKKEET